MSRGRKRPRGARNGAAAGGFAPRPAAAIALPRAGFADRTLNLPGQQTGSRSGPRTGHQIAPDALRAQPPHIPDPPLPARAAPFLTSQFTPHLE